MDIAYHGRLDGIPLVSIFYSFGEAVHGMKDMPYVMEELEMIFLSATNSVSSTVQSNVCSVISIFVDN